ncbi:BrnA antitoxin family protein [Caballeronia sp. DA-9]|uniref:BrnA antitoxin family protein n=1 Tax=Caballeronia sp. DA-9 TaxID=3436237 RepID=UPI003F6782FE
MSSKRKIVMPTDAEDAEINRGIAADPDARELSADEMRRMRPVRETLAERVGTTAADTLLKRRGRPPAEVTKEAISLRCDRDLVEAFRSTGDGWQTRINEALREYATSHHML